MKFLLTLAVLFSTFALAADRPGGLTRTATNLKAQTYELMLSPAYTIAPGGAYLTSELRFQPSEDIGLGFGFGAGELGFNFGVHGVWNVLPQLKLVPQVAVLGGAYFNRVAGANYFVVKLAPTVSHTFQSEWGDVTPYGAIALAPSFSLVQSAANLFSIKGSLGSQLAFKGMDGLRVMTEVSLGLLNSTYEIGLGLTYPFAAL